MHHKTLLLLVALSLLAVPATAESADTAPEVTRVERGNLVLENVPEIPERIGEQMRRYQSIRSAELQGWHPAGDGIVISTRFGETEQIHHVREPGGARRQLTFFREPVRNAAVNPQRAHPGFLFPKDTGGSESYQLFHYHLPTGDVRPVSDGSSRNGAPTWAHDGRRFAYFSTARNGRDWDVLVDTLGGEGEPHTVLAEGGAWIPGEWSPDGTHLLVTRLVSIQESYPHLLHLQSRELTPLTVGTEPAAYGEFHFSHDGTALYYTSNRDSEFQRLRRRDLDTGEITVLTEDVQWDVEDVAPSPAGDHLVYTVNEAGSSRLVLVNTTTWTELPLPRLPSGLIDDLHWDPEGKRIGFVLETPRFPGDVYSLDVETGELLRWTRSEVGGLDNESFAVPTLVHYPTFDQVDGQPRQIPAFYYRPEGEGPFPVVIDIHGGPEGQSRPGFETSIQYWVKELGIAVLVPNVRGSSGYGKSYLQLDNAELREDSVKDVGKLLDWIGAQPELDQDRVAVYGGSYGGYMVLASMVHYNDRLRAGVDVVGISNFVTFLENTRDYRRDLRRVEYGDERDPEMRRFLESISPANQADKIKKPLLVVQGLNDPRVPASESEQMVEEIRDNGGQVWYVLAKDEGHGFRKKTNRDFFRNAVVLFFERHLLGP